MPNLVTVLRILLVPFFFSALLYYSPERDFLRAWAFVLFLVASLTDAIDGLLARIRRETSELGRFLDPLADKLLLLSGFLGILVAKNFPMVPPRWVVVTIVFRDLVILGGLIVLFMSSQRTEVSPNFLGKMTTAFQMATVLAVLLVLPISPLLWNITAALTIVSGLSYILREMRKRKA